VLKNLLPKRDNFLPQAELASFFLLFVFIDQCRELPDVFLLFLCSLFRASIKSWQVIRPISTESDSLLILQGD